MTDSYRNRKRFNPTGHSRLCIAKHHLEGGVAAAKCRRPPICELDVEVHPRSVHFVLLEDGGSDNTRIVIRRVRVVDRLSARFRSACSRSRARGGPVT